MFFSCSLFTIRSNDSRHVEIDSESLNGHHEHTYAADQSTVIVLIGDDVILTILEQFFQHFWRMLFRDRIAEIQIDNRIGEILLLEFIVV